MQSRSPFEEIYKLSNRVAKFKILGNKLDPCVENADWKRGQNDIFSCKLFDLFDLLRKFRLFCVI